MSLKEDLINFIWSKYKEAGWLSYFDDDIEKVFQNNIAVLFDKIYDSSNKFLFILCGPQGSGKTTVASLILRTLGIGFDDCVRTGIDDLVYNSKKYHDEINILTHKPIWFQYVQLVNLYIDRLATCDDDPNLVEQIKSHPVVTEMRSLYFSIRTVMNSINDRFLELAMKLKRHIIFEMVGVRASTSDWYNKDLISHCGENGIKTVVIYPYVDPHTIKIRYLRRAIIEHYVLNIYDKSLISAIISELGVFTKAASLVYIVDNRNRLDPEKPIPYIFIKQKKEISGQPGTSVTEFNENISIDDEMKTAITFMRSSPPQARWNHIIHSISN